MEEWQQDLSIKGTEGQLSQPAKIIFYIFRHGHSNYKEELGKNSHQQTGHWNQSLVDLVTSGIATIKKSATYVSQEIDPKTQIVTLFASPRARTIASAKIIEAKLQKCQIELIPDQQGEFIHVAEILRSGGDFAPIYNQKTNGDEPDGFEAKGIKKSVYLQRIHISTGLRFQKFLSYMIKNYSQKFSNPKEPVFIAVTHNEVVSAFLASLGIIKDYKEETGIIPAGAFFKISINTKKPNMLTVSFPDPAWHFKDKKINWDDQKN